MKSSSNKRHFEPLEDRLLLSASPTLTDGMAFGTFEDFPAETAPIAEEPQAMEAISYNYTEKSFVTGTLKLTVDDAEWVQVGSSYRLMGVDVSGAEGLSASLKLTNFTYLEYFGCSGLVDSDGNSALTSLTISGCTSLKELY